MLTTRCPLKANQQHVGQALEMVMVCSRMYSLCIHLETDRNGLIKVARGDSGEGSTLPSGMFSLQNKLPPFHAVEIQGLLKTEL